MDRRRLAVFVLSSSIGSLISVDTALPLYVTALGGTMLTLGLIYSIRGLAGLLARLISGYFTDRIGRKPVIVASIGLRSVGSAILALATGVQTLIPAMVVRSLANAVENPALLALISDLTVVGSMGLAFGLFFSARGVFSTVAPIVTGWIADIYGFRVVFTLSLVLYLASLLAVSRFIPEPRTPPAQTGQQGLEFKTLVLDKRLALFTTAFLLMFAAQTSFLPFFSVLAVNVLGCSYAELGLIVGLGEVLALAGRMLSGWVTDRLGPKKALMAAASTRLCAFMAVTMANSFPTLLLSYLMSRLFMFAPPRNTALSLMAPQSSRGMIFALMGVSIDLGRLVGSSTAGLLATLYGAYAPFQLMAALTLCFIFLVAFIRLPGSALASIQRNRF